MNSRPCLSNHRVYFASVLILAAAWFNFLPTVSAEPPSTALPGEEVNLQTVPELQRIVSGEYMQPTAGELLDNLRRQTGHNLTLDDSVLRDRPIQGYTKCSAGLGSDARTGQEQVRAGPLAQDRRRIPSVRHLQGRATAAPRPVPPEVEYAIKHNTEVKVDPGPSLPTASRWTAGHVTGIAGGFLLLLAISAVLLWRLRRAAVGRRREIVRVLNPALRRARSRGG